MGARTGRPPGKLSVEVRAVLDDDESGSWDRLVAATELSDVTQLSAWARLRGSAGYAPTYLLAWQDDHLVGGAQILSRRIPLIGRVGYLSYGPLMASHVSRVELREALCTALADCAARMTALFVQPPLGAEDVSAELLRRGFRLSEAEIAPVASLRLDLGVGEDRLRAGLNKRLRGWTKQWAARGVTVRAGDERDVTSFARLMAESAAYQGYEPLSAAYLLGYFRELAPGGFVKLFVGEVAGNPIAARMYTVCGDAMKPRLAGMFRSSDGARLSVPAAVEWHAIRWAEAQGVRWFDSGGIRRSSADLLMSGRSVGPSDIGGPDWFKASFGGCAYTYPSAVEHVSSPIVRKGYDLVRQSRRAEDALQLIRRQVRGGTVSRRSGTRRAGAART